MMRRAAFWAIAAFAAELSACGGGGHQAIMRGNCFPYPLPAPPPMIYPQNGATNVSDGNFTLILGFAYAPAMSLQSASATVGPLSPTAAPSPLPSEAATPIPNVTPAAYAVPALQRTTNYTISAQFSYANACPVTFGSFTTM